MLRHGVPEHVRSDNGAERADLVLERLASLGSQPLFIEPAVYGKTATSNRSTASCGTSV